MPKTFEQLENELERVKPLHHSELPVEVTCPDCKGECIIDCEEMNDFDQVDFRKCDTCKGTGKVMED